MRLEPRPEFDRTCRVFWKASGAAALIAAALASSAQAQDIQLQPPKPAAPRPATQAITPLQAAQLLIQAGKLPEARKVLLALQAQSPKDSEVQFLLAMIAVQEKDYPAAIRLYRAILVREPGALRVRLELARTFFLLKDYDNAERQFRFARAGDASEAVKQNIDRYLYVIRLARRFSYNIAVAAAPDTNLNAGPAISTVEIYGLPFALSDQARKQSGVGASIDAGGEWSPPITDTLRARVGVQLHRSDYSGGQFDDMTLSAYAGPKLLGPRFEISPLATVFRRWYGNQVYNQGVGGSLQGTYYPRPKIGVTASVGGQIVTFAQTDMNGPAYSASLGAFYTPDSASVVSGNLSVSRQGAVLPVYANTAVQLALGYYRDLPHGFSVSVQPSFARIDYDDQYVAFGAVRHDRQWSAQISLLNRRIDLWGFTPRLAYTYTVNSSTISLFRYDRQRIETGFTRNF
jgi:tetratricopeptide (TPR) repeat protein